jgi:hypothetical protein
MKTLGLSLLLLLPAVVASAAAQEQAKDSTAADKAIIQEWRAHANEPDSATIQGDRFILSFDDRDSFCAFMRTYRVKRDERGSDVTRPAGYTTCVPVQRFGVKRAAPLPDKASPSQ